MFRVTLFYAELDTFARLDVYESEVMKLLDVWLELGRCIVTNLLTGEVKYYWEEC